MNGFAEKRDQKSESYVTHKLFFLVSMTKIVARPATTSLLESHLYTRILNMYLNKLTFPFKTFN